MADPKCDILLLNNDTIVTPRWLDNLHICLNSNRKIGAAGAVCNHNDNLQWCEFEYSDLNEMQILAGKNNISDPNKWEEKVFLIGFCILIKREVLDKIGPLEEMYSPGYVEDNDLCLRIFSAGYKLILCHDCFIHHYLGSSFHKDMDGFYTRLYKNREIFKQKWGFDTWRFDQVKFASLKLLDEPDKYKQMNILELGCGMGLTLLKCKFKYPNAVLHGLEPIESLASIAKHSAAVSLIEPGKFPLDFPENHFDYILVGNHLEMTEDPENLLTGLRKYLKEGGWIIAEVQNIMHFSVLRDLINGKWRNETSDILHKWNKNFFTLNDITNLLNSSKYESQFVFHWFSVLNEEDKTFIQKLCQISDKTEEHIFGTYLYTIKAKK